MGLAGYITDTRVHEFVSSLLNEYPEIYSVVNVPNTKETDICMITQKY